MSKKPIISICIPTYNRELYLKELLDSIVSQKVFVETDDIEIVIDDGPSKDNTEQLIKLYQKNYPNKIRYYRNDKAIGMCPAFLEAISFSGGEYTWLFGSDDLMTDGSLKATLDVIKSKNPGVILSDRYVFSGKLSDEKIPSPIDKNNIVLNGGDDFFSFLGKDNKENGAMNGNFFTFISIFCFKQDLYLKNKQLFSEKYGKIYKRGIEHNYFNFAIIPFLNLSNQKIVIIKNKILVLARGGNHGWSFNSMNIFKDLYFIIKVIRDNYKVPFKCNVFFNHMLLGWFLPSVMGIIKKNRLLKFTYPVLMFIYNPLSKLMNKFLRMF